MKEAMLYEKLDQNRVRCNLCAHHCLIAEGKKGICQVRENREGQLYSLVYGRTISQNIDPIEKKPLFHFYPGSTAYSIATPGCNFRCAWCQNWEISQMLGERQIIAGYEATPEQIITRAQRHGCRSIAYTYTEPTIFFEITRFFPDYQLRDIPPTPQNSLEQAWEIGKSEGLRYVYLGNVSGEEKQNTLCPECGTLLIRRNIFGVVANRIKEGCCPDCGCAVAGVGMSEKPHSASVVTRQK